MRALVCVAAGGGFFVEPETDPGKYRAYEISPEENLASDVGGGRSQGDYLSVNRSHGSVGRQDDPMSVHLPDRVLGHGIFPRAAAHRLHQVGEGEHFLPLVFPGFQKTLSRREFHRGVKMGCHEKEQRAGDKGHFDESSHQTTFSMSIPRLLTTSGWYFRFERERISDMVSRMPFATLYLLLSVVEASKTSLMPTMAAGSEGLLPLG